MTNISEPRYTYTQGGKAWPVAPARAGEAEKIDENHDHQLSDQEVADYLRRTDALEDPARCAVNQGQVLAEFKAHLSQTIPRQVAAYHSYDQVGAELSRLEQAYPDLAQKVSLGQTPEGREIWALKISQGAASSDTSHKPGIVITGCHHAREWMSMEAPLYLAGQLLDQYATDPATKKRVDEGEIWVIPLVNPDGYEYSRTVDNWWRKNRRPVTDTGCHSGQCALRSQVPVGVDLNRNYYDGNPDHFQLYRPAGDEPCNTDDDFGWAVSDDPESDTYRGPAGGTEAEVQALLNLELKRGNIKGIIDHHGYGEMILYPWGSTNQPVENVDMYRQIGTHMNEAMAQNGGPYRLMQSIDLYPTSGTSNDITHANGIPSYTIELGQSFQPEESEIDPIRKQVAAANLVFIDEILARNTPAPPSNPPGK